MTSSLRIMEQVFHTGLTREQQDLAMRMHDADLNSDFDAIETGHDDIAEEYVGSRFLSDFNCLNAVVHCSGLKAIAVKNELQRVGDDSFVVDYENAGWVGSSRSSHRLGE